MRSVFPFILVAATALPPGAANSGSDRLALLKWKSRPVIILSDSRDDPRVAQQVSALAATKAAVEERNIKVLTERGRSGALRRQLGVTEGFAVVLVGKDGAVKKVWRDAVDPEQIFTLIDQMPMRRDEMRG